MTFFGGNAFATPVGQKIETATSDTLASEDWGLNLEICDFINQTDEGPKDAIKAMKKRLSTTPKNYTVILYTLTVLETCVKNCRRQFHVHVCTKDFVQEMVKLIGPKNDPPPVVQEKVLSLIQSWSEAFRHEPDLAGVSQVYAELKHKGVEFPASDLDMMVPILTPQRTVEHQRSPQRTAPVGAPSPPEAPPTAQLLTVDQKAKLASELDVVESNAKVMADMLTELTPGKEHPQDQQLLQDLYVTCCEMKQRVVELVGRVNDDLLTANLLRINDNLNNLFIRYERYNNKVRGERSPRREVAPPRPDVTPSRPDVAPPRPDIAPPRPDVALPRPDIASNQARITSSKATKQPEVSLIDLCDDVPPHKLNDLSINPPKKADDLDFDSLAQSRMATSEISKASGSTLLDSNIPDIAAVGLSKTSNVKAQQKDTDFEEMEKWLNENPPKQGDEGAVKSANGDDTITSSEFDRFLAERVAASDTLPTITAATGSNPPHPQPQPRQRTIARADDKDKAMFAL